MGTGCAWEEWLVACGSDPMDRNILGSDESRSNSITLCGVAPELTASFGKLPKLADLSEALPPSTCCTPSVFH